MSRVTIIKTAAPMPGEEILSMVRNFLFVLFDGWRNDDKKGCQRSSETSASRRLTSPANTRPPPFVHLRSS